MSNESISLGAVIFTAVKPIIKIYLIIATGFVLAKRNILTVEAARTVSDIVLTTLLPCLIFNKIVSNLQDSDIKNVGIICLTSLIIFGTGGFMSIITKFVTPAPRRWLGGLLAGGIFPNISDIPIAYLQTMDTGIIFDQADGEKGIAHVIIFLTMFTICLFNLGGFRLIEMDFKYDEKLEKEATKDLENAEFELTDNPKINDNDIDKTLTEGLETTQNADKDIGHEDEEDEEDEDEDEDDQMSTSRENLQPIALVESDPNNNSKGLIDQPDNTSGSAISLQTRSRSNSTTSFRRRHRRSSASSHIFGRSLYPTKSRNSMLSTVSSGSRIMELRSLPAQNIEDVIVEFNNPIAELQPTLTRIMTTDIGIMASDVEKQLTNRLLSSVIFFLQNCLRPCSIATIFALLVAFVPWLKSLFVINTQVELPNAPDGLPPLNFIMDYTAYIGAASVPFALMTLGACIARLSIGSLPKGFWKTALLLVILRLCILPIIGILWVNRLVSSGWIDKEDQMMQFVLILSFSLPSMTTQVFFTAFHTKPDRKDRLQMDCISLYLLMQYPLLVITLPFVVTYVIKVQFKF
ncbi:hypothetical protein WICMUC_001718 [Wickerhamomyces mucosus]|uniref:Protein ECM3 n=1 Tax=Wickerhamomyces mucosus TaxID=1378264 RepID=A0A9P8TGC9_9ASCO|nr:hypothetical protein WICMUC_001718 [Wickerhamomyces mucosus]